MSITPMDDRTECACGCGTLVAAMFAPGHDLKAIQQVIRSHYGTVRAFLEAHQ